MSAAALRPSLVITRRLAASPALVWRCWTEPAMMMRWWATKDAVTLRAETDLRPGGRYRVAFRTPDGETHDVSGVYDEVAAPERLVFSWAWITTPDRLSRVTLDFRSAGGGTEFTLTHELFADASARDNHRSGWSEALDNLEACINARSRTS